MSPQRHTQHVFTLGGPSRGSLVARILGVVAGLAMFFVSIVVGGVLLLIFLAVGLSIAAAFGIRFWWWQRGARKSGRTVFEEMSAASAPRGTDASSRTTIDGDFHVVDD